MKSDFVRPDTNHAPNSCQETTKVDNLQDCLGLQVEVFLKLIVAPAAKTGTRALHNQEICVVYGRELDCLCLCDADQGKLCRDAISKEEESHDIVKRLLQSPYLLSRKPDLFRSESDIVLSFRKWWSRTFLLPKKPRDSKYDPESCTYCHRDRVTPIVVLDGVVCV